MAFIELHRDDNPSEATELLEAERVRVGYIPNYSRLFARRPGVYDAWRRLVGSITQTLDRRRYELVTLAAARRLRSSYCMLAHGTILREEFFDDDAVRRLVFDHRTAGLDPVDVAVMDFAEKVAGDASAITDDDVERLRQLGLSDDEVLDVALAAAARCFFSKTLDALGVEPDAVYSGLEPELRDALVVGRPIVDAGSR